MAITKTPDKINKSTQEMQNLGFDTEFNLPAVEMLGYDSTASTINRLRVNSSGELITEFPSGTGSNGSVTLTDADTAYPVPTTASTEKHVLILYNGSDTDMYWGYENSNANGAILEVGEKVALALGANQQVYLYCGSAGKVITCPYKEI